MDFDPGFHEEMYDEGDLHDSYKEEYEVSQDEEEPAEEETEFDSMGNPIFLTAAVILGRQMAEEEIDERRLAENILKNRTKGIEPIKVPLAKRHEVKGHMTPFGRWATKANLDPSKAKDELEYTLEEQLQMIRAEGEGHD
jgi:hypothetical protein